MTRSIGIEADLVAMRFTLEGIGEREELHPLDEANPLGLCKVAALFRLIGAEGFACDSCRLGDPALAAEGTGS